MLGRNASYHHHPKWEVYMCAYYTHISLRDEKWILELIFLSG